jgi:hypothetical protein
MTDKEPTITLTYRHYKNVGYYTYNKIKINDYSTLKYIKTNDLVDVKVEDKSIKQLPPELLSFLEGVDKLKYLEFNCKSLTSIPNIEELHTLLCYCCDSLETLP